MPLLILRTLGELLAFAVSAFAAGSLVVAAARRLSGSAPKETPTLRGAAVRLLAGFGAVAYATLVLALLHGLRWWVLTLLGVALVLAAREELGEYRRALALAHGDPLALGACALAVAMASGQFLAALAPPEAYDELAYHLPIARAIDSEHAATQLLHAHGIYGNLPSLGECLYAAALAVDGTALVHAVHLAVLLAFVTLAAALVREQWGSRAGALAAVALLAYPHLTYNATTAYVDAAATSFELGALLLALRWFGRDEPADLVVSGVLAGLALSVKYTSLFTVGLVALVVGVGIARRGAARLGLTAAWVAVLVGAFWYVKNLVRFGNPVWPFYLGHRSLDDATYVAFMNGVHSFGPRTVKAFVEVPWRLAGDPLLIPFLAVSLVVLALLVRPSRGLAAYAVVFLSYWFWVATHQIRFLLSGATAAILAVVVALTSGGRAIRVGFACAAVAAVAVAQARLHPFSIADVPSALAAQVGSPKAQYALGLESRSAFLSRYFGCEADAVAYLDARPSLSPVLMRQTALEPWFAHRTRFGKLPLAATTRTRATRALRAGGFRSALVRESEPGTFATGDAASAAVTRRLRVVWRRGDCTLLVVRRSG